LKVPYDQTQRGRQGISLASLAQAYNSGDLEAAVRLAKTVLHGPAILAPVERPKSRGVGTVVASISALTVAISVPVTWTVVISVSRAVIVTISRRRIAAEVQVNSLRGHWTVHADDRSGHECEY
jgi:hypothetical protein